MDSKTEFEKWFKGSQNVKLDVDKQGNYVYSQAYSAWVTWQACQELNDKRIGGDISEWLKEDETIIQRLERERKDCTSTLKLYAKEKAKVEKLESRLKVASEALTSIVGDKKSAGFLGEIDDTLYSMLDDEQYNKVGREIGRAKLEGDKALKQLTE